MCFIYLNRSGENPGNKEVQVFFPGWGFDGWSALLFPQFRHGDLVIPDGTMTPEVAVELTSFLKENRIEEIHLVGWSMGANLGLDYALENRDMVASLTLAAMRRSWPSLEIRMIREGLSAAGGQFMEEFYRKCFLGSRPIYRRFTGELQEKYLTDLHIDRLAAGLDYLEQYEFEDLPAAAGTEILVLHGARDIVAPVRERPKPAGARETIFPHLGHAVLSGE